MSRKRIPLKPTKKRVRLDDDEPVEDELVPIKKVKKWDNPLAAKGGDGSRVGRPLGARHHIPKRFTEALGYALAMHGMDGKGKNGLAGYFYFLARTDPKATAVLIAKCMPQKVQTSVDPESALGQVLEAVRARLAYERNKQIEARPTVLGQVTK